MLATCSPDRQQSLAAFEPAGLLRALQPEQVLSLRLRTASAERRYIRAANGAWQGEGASDHALDAALRLLRNAAAERDLDSAAPEFGLDHPALDLLVETPTGSVEVAFGATNPIGMARYVRLRRGTASTLHLLPAYVADAFEQLMPARAMP